MDFGVATVARRWDSHALASVATAILKRDRAIGALQQNLGSHSRSLGQRLPRFAHAKENAINAFTNLIGGMTQVWLNVAFIVCLFTVLIFRPERITNRSLLKLAAFLFAASLLFPPLSMLLPSDTATPTRPQEMFTVGMQMKLVNLVSMLCFCGAFVSAVLSLTPSAED